MHARVQVVDVRTYMYNKYVIHNTYRMYVHPNPKMCFIFSKFALGGRW